MIKKNKMIMIRYAQKQLKDIHELKSSIKMQLDELTEMPNQIMTQHINDF